MTLHFRGLHLPRWLAQAPANRGMMLVVAIIVVSLLFGVLRALDTAVSRDVLTRQPALAAPAASSIWMAIDPARDGARPVEADLVDVPDATAEAISL